MAKPKSRPKENANVEETVGKGGYGGVELGSNVPQNDINVILGVSKEKKSQRAQKVEVSGAEFWINKPFNLNPTLHELLGLSHQPSDIIKRCRDAYRTEDLVGGIVDVCIDFLCAAVENRHPDPKVRKFYDDWAQSVKLRQMLRWVAQGYFVDGTVDIYKVLGKYKPNNENLFKKVASKIKEAVSKGGQIPTDYATLDTLNVEVSGSGIFGDISFALRPSIELEELLRKKPAEMTTAEKETISKLPDIFKKSGAIGQAVVLPAANICRVKRKARPYELYGHSLIERSLGNVEMLRRMKAADLTTIDGIVNQIITFTVGSDEHPAKEGEIRALADIVKKVGFAKAFKLYWNHTLKVTRVMPDNINEILGDAKYKPIKNGIKEGMGAVEVFLGGSDGGNFNSSYLSIRSLEKALQSAADEIIDQWLADDYALIAEQMGFDEPATPVFTNLEFIDIVKYGMLMAQLVDRGIVSVDDASNAVGYDFAQTQAKLVEENKLRQEGILPPMGAPTQMSKAGVAVPNYGKPIQATGKPMTGRDSTNLQTGPGPQPKVK